MVYNKKIKINKDKLKLKSDIIKLLLNNTKLNEEDLFNKIINNKTITDSVRGYRFETLCQILTITKCLKIEWTDFKDGQLSCLNNLTNIKSFLKKSISDRSGGKSDLTIKNGSKTICFSIKYKKKFIPGDSDIEKLNDECRDLFSDYSLGFICKDKELVLKHGHEHKKVKQYFDNINLNSLLLDENDIKVGLKIFMNTFKKLEAYDNFCEEINLKYLKTSRQKLICKLHQQITLKSFIKNFKVGELQHLISHKTRSGKSITQILIMKYLIEQGYKVLFMTSVPATINSFIEDIDNFIEFKSLENYIKLEGDNTKSIDKSFRGLTLCSVQYLKNDKTGKKTNFLKAHKYDAIIIDECHYASSTKKTKDKILNVDVEELRKNIKISIFASGTSQKTQKFYKIKQSCIYKWELYDEGQMKKLYQSDFKDENIINDMVLRHSDHFRHMICDISLNRDYTNMPSQVLMKAKIPDLVVDKINKFNSQNNTKFGFNCSSLFANKQELCKTDDGKAYINYLPEFEICKTEDGVSIMIDYLDNIISNNKMKNTVMKRIELSQNQYKSRKSSKDDPKMFIIYLPTHTRNGTIDMIQKALINFLEKNKLWSNYHIVAANSKENMGDYKEEYNKEILNALDETKKQNKKGCILLLGDKGNTGITYHNCDVSIHFDDGHLVETQIQKRARPGTSGEGKTIFINVDMNIQRSYRTLSETIKQYQVGTKKEWSYKEILLYLYQHKLFLWDDEEFNNGEMLPIEIENYFEKLSDTIINDIDYITIMNELCEEIKCNDSLSEHMTNIKHTSYVKLNEDIEGLQQEVPKGEITKKAIEKIIKENSTNEKEKEDITTEVEDTINKTEELMKSKRGLPFLGLLSKEKNMRDLKVLINEYSDIIKEILRPFIIKIDLKYVYDIYKLTMNDIISSHEEIVNQIIEIYSTTTPTNLRVVIANHFVSSSEDELAHAEIPTPVFLCNNIINIIPELFWLSKNKIFEPCCGKGNFVLAIFDKFYEGLKDKIPDDYERCKTIITECLYFADINPLDIFITKALLRCHIQSYTSYDILDYDFNDYIGNTLELDVQEYWSINGFDCVIGNPPYNSPGTRGSGNTIWQKFTKTALTTWLVPNGYLSFVHPPGWRKPNTTRGKFNGLFKLMSQDNQMNYLEIHGIKDGKKTFNKGTRYDFYQIQKKEKTKNTVVIDENGEKCNIDMKKFDWLPNSNIESIQNLILQNSNEQNEEECPIIYNRSNYGSDKKNTSHTETEEFKYPLIHATNKNGIRYMYSNCNDNGHFGISKVIFGQTGLNDVIVDMEGKYGMTEHAMAIYVDNIIEAKNIKDVLLSEKFKQTLNSTMFSNFMIDWRLFKNFKRDFWKDFI